MTNQDDPDDRAGKQAGIIPNLPLTLTDEVLGEHAKLNRTRLYRYARRWTGSAEDANDLVAEAILKAFKSKHTYKPVAPVGAWLFAILRTTIYRHHRRSMRLPTVPWNVVAPEQPGPEHPFGDQGWQREWLDRFRAFVDSADIDLVDHDVMTALLDGKPEREAAKVLGIEKKELRRRCQRVLEAWIAANGGEIGL